MSGDLGKGDFIECIEGYTGIKYELVVGRLYCVEEVMKPDDERCSLHNGSDCFGVRLTSPTLPRNMHWCGKRFKPVYKRRDGLFEHLTRNLDEPISGSDPNPRKRKPQGA